MINTIIFNNGVEIGAFSFPDRKKPYIAIKTGGKILCYGQFHDEAQAQDFMNALCENLGVNAPRAKSLGCAQVSSAKRGTWIKFGDTGSEYTDRWQCDQCLRTVRSERWGKTCEYEMCPHCGVVMGEDDKNAENCPKKKEAKDDAGTLDSKNKNL